MIAVIFEAELQSTGAKYGALQPTQWAWQLDPDFLRGIVFTA
jgi:hypothetical protein